MTPRRKVVMANRPARTGLISRAAAVAVCDRVMADLAAMAREASDANATWLLNKRKVARLCRERISRLPSVQP